MLCFQLTWDVLLLPISCNAEFTALLIVSVNREARFCALELDVLPAIFLTMLTPIAAKIN